MREPLMLEVALNAAGISDAFTTARICDHDGSDKYSELADLLGGWIGIAEAIAEAAIEMERARISVGEGRVWGEGLPHVYEAWSAIGRALWREIATKPAVEIARDAGRTDPLFGRTGRFV